MYLNGRSTSVRDRLLSIPFEDMAVCSVVKAELFYGARRSNNPTRTLEQQQEILGRFASLPGAAMLADNTSALKLTQTGKGVIWLFSLPC
jgi:predicted nucleic acid-binding protein